MITKNFNFGGLNLTGEEPVMPARDLALASVGVADGLHQALARDFGADAALTQDLG